MRSAIVSFALLAFALAASAEAQRQPVRGAQPPRAPTVSAAEARQRAIRAELADVLLQSKRYAEAAREYRSLVEADSTNTRYRLGLAQALAWGERYRDAERELRILALARPRDAAVDTLLRSVRASMQPRAREAAAWVSERPGYAPYRYSLARALAREGRHCAALVQYDTLLALGPNPALLREMAATYRAARDLPGGIELLRSAVARAPADTATRRAYAALLVEDRRYDAALAQIDTVLLQARSPSTLAERASVNIARRDLDAAIADLSASIAIGPTTAAHLALGDIHRWRGEFADARSSYDRARALSPGSRDVTMRFAQLARDERPAILFDAPLDVQPGWRAHAANVSDNIGTEYSTFSVRRGFAAPFGLLGSAGVEVRDLREQLPLEQARTTGYAAEAALARGASRGALYAELGASGGIVHHPGAGSRPFGGVELAAQYFAWTLRGELATGPAYPSLLTTAFLTPSDDGTPWLWEHAMSGSLSGPIAGVDVGVGIRRSEFNDDNRRTVVQGYARYPLSRLVSAVYSGSAIAFANRSPLYWDPSRHVTSTLGLQAGERRPRGFSWVAAIAPGVAYAEETPYLRAPVGEADRSRLRAQIGASAELVYRGERWEASTAYGWGRLGGYDRSDARIGLRLLR